MVMSYTVGETVEVCLEFDLPPTRGIRRIVGVFANERGDVVELTDVPARMVERREDGMALAHDDDLLGR